MAICTGARRILCVLRSKGGHLLSVACMVCFATGCALAMHGTTQDLRIVSYPSGARVGLDWDAVGTTPTIVKVRRGKRHNVSVILDGYHSYDTVLDRKLSGWYWGNILFGWGAFATAPIDLFSGAAYNVTPKEINVNLRKEK